MAFNPSKCYLLHVCRTKCPFIHPYTMLGHTLQAVDHYPYLRVSLSGDLNWKPLILNITNKANLTLGFVKRNLHHCPQRVKDQAYKLLVRPTLKDGYTVWDLYRAYQKLWLEQVQCRAVHFVTRIYTREEGCVTNALRQINWPTLEKRRQVATLMYKCVTNQTAINIPSYVHQSSLKTRSSHPLNLSHFSHPVTRTNTAFGQELSLTGIACHLIIQNWIQLQNLKPPSLTTFFQCDVYLFQLINLFTFFFSSYFILPSCSALVIS